MTNTNPTTTKAWKKLEAHYSEVKNIDFKKEFRSDPGRANTLLLSGKIFMWITVKI